MLLRAMRRRRGGDGDGEPDAPPRSRWGPSDELGAANLLSAVVTAETASLVGRGRVFDLSQPISTRSPRLEALMSPYSMCMWSNPVISRRYVAETFGVTNGIGYADERIELDLHTGTHIDALGHVFVDDRGYNGLSAEAVVSNWGLRKLGIENLPPVVTRGILADARAVRGRALEPGEPITVSDLEQAFRLGGVEAHTGDVVLVRTGWAEFYGVDNPAYTSGWPGITIEAARWLAARDVVIVGADTMGLEVYPDLVAGEHAPVHAFLLPEAGVHILEQANLEELAVAGVHEFLCLCLAPRFVGGTAAPVRLVAIG
jgi:kynurenine formamidase